MIVGRMAKHSHALLALLIILVVSSLVLGMNVLPASESAPPDAPAAEADSSPSVTCIPLGLSGYITAPVVVDRLSEGSDNLTFLGTSNGLYVVDPGGKLQHFLYTPSYGVQYVALINDTNGDGVREVVVALNDTQVPALRCYDGATWEKLWQFAPMARVWDRLWVERQFSITDLEVISTGSSQSVVITSGRCVFSINAEDGTERWRFSASSALGKMATVADLNGDDTDEVFVGSDDGHLYLLNGKTGEARWQTELPSKSAQGEAIEAAANDILTLDREGGRVAVVSRDGLARVFDLRKRKAEWAVAVSDKGLEGWRITLVPDITSDGLPEMLVTYASSYNSGASNEEGVVLFDSDGNKLWDKNLYVWHDTGAELGSFGGKPVILEPKEQEIRLIDLKNGETVVKTIPITTLDGKAPMVRQVGETNFLLTSSGSDLSVVSASGETIGNCPWISSVKAEGGSFVGNTAEDTLFQCAWGNTGYYYTSAPSDKNAVTLVTPGASGGTQVQEPEARLLMMMDGATRAIAWSYQVPFSELKSIGGLKGIHVTPDLVGNDGIQDIIGYREDTVFIFSGKDGTPSGFSVAQPIASLDVIRNGASGNAITVGTTGGLMIFDSTGTELWTTTSADWVGDESASFMVLDDVNSDNVSDLAVLSDAKIVVLRSVDSASNYQLHQTFDVEAGYSIVYAEVVPDGNKDGVRDLACIETAVVNQQPGQNSPPGCPLLLERSPVDGKELLRIVLPGSRPTIDIACGDFNGDGYADTLLCEDPSDSCGGVPPQGWSPDSGLELQVLSGKDGAKLWTHVLKMRSYNWSGWGTKPPATIIGDVTGDGKDDLAWTVDDGGVKYSGYYCLQRRLEIYDVAHDATLKDIPATPMLTTDLYHYGTSSEQTLLQAEVDGDGHPEIIMSANEPSLPLYDSNGSSSEYKSSLAVMDVDTGQRLASFMGFGPTAISLFKTHQPGILGMAQNGGAYFLDVNPHLQVTSPQSGAKTGPSVSVAWEGTSNDEFAQVFVDGVRNRTCNDKQTDLYLAHGQHDLVVSSIDDCGRMSYSPADLGAPVTIKVTPSPWKPVWLVLSLFVLLAVIVLLFYARLHRMRRARRRVAK